jgi:protein-disulfide isomerase
MQKYRPFLIIALVLAIAIVGGAILLRSNRNSSFGAAPAGLQPSPSRTENKTASQAVVKLEEFGDYQCPSCGELHPSLKKLKTEFGPKLNFVFRNLPLTTIHKNSMAAAQAAEAARMQNRFWEMHDLLYENQGLWKDDVNPKTVFLKFATDLGLDATRFSRDMDDKQVQLRIQVDQEAAAELGINGTPTLLIDGRQMRPEATTPEGIRKAVEIMLTRKDTPTR